MKKLGMVSFRNSVYFLPYSEDHYEIAQWLCQEIQTAAGEATLLKVEKVENLSDGEVAALFSRARDEDYSELLAAATGWKQRLERLYARKNRETAGASAEAGILAEEMRLMEKRMTQIGAIDFFGAGKKAEAARELGNCRRELGKLLAPQQPPAQAGLPQLDPCGYQSKTWITRPRPHVDRMATAWAIRRFIDPAARFEFAVRHTKSADRIPFDYLGAELGHQGEDCTLETLVGRFGIDDSRLEAVAQIVHDADLKDAKFSRPEAAGLDAILAGLAANEPDDDKLLESGFAIIDALYAGLEKARIQKTTRRKSNAADRGTS